MEIDCEYTDELVCPYCGVDHQDDGELNEAGEFQCSGCDKKFMFEVDYSKSFTSKQVPCLNGSPHDFRRFKWSDKQDQLSCKHCSKREYVDRASDPTEQV